jgi:large subunit ribosomal protein L21
VFYLDERLFECRATVMGTESEPLRVEEKTKRRQRHVKHVRSKMRYTVLRVSELRVRGLEEYEGIVKEGGEQ